MLKVQNSFVLEGSLLGKKQPEAQSALTWLQLESVVYFKHLQKVEVEYLILEREESKARDLLPTRTCMLTNLALRH